MTDQFETKQEIPAPPSKHQLLEELEIVIGQREGDLSLALRRLDCWAKCISGELGHYLQRRSYLKAHAWVEVSRSKEEARGGE